MHKGTLAGRMLEARKRIVAAVDTAVATSGLNPAALDDLRAAQRQKDADVRALYELEAVAPIVEALNANLSEAVADRQTAVLEQGEDTLSESEILAIPGLTKTSKEAIIAYFEALHAPAD
ncbi:MAG: hypothetical protein H6661_10110 [Ardenticatenaceae bacterium]|nr:hypothetical protein [Ardenticatenaceae bacterium]